MCNNLVSKLKPGADVRPPAELRTFTDELSNTQVTLEGNDMVPEMDTQSNIVHISRRLIPQLRYKWCDNVMKKKATSAYLTFSDFVLYMQEHADNVNDPIYWRDALINRSPSYRSPLKPTVNQMQHFLLMTAKSSVCVVCVINIINCIIFSI